MAKAASKGRVRPFGQCRQLPSGRWQARYQYGVVWYKGPTTYEARQDGEAWLANERKLIEYGTWTSPAEREIAANNVIFGGYVETWRRSKGKLKPRTMEEYNALLERLILPTFGGKEIASITSPMIEAWHNDLPDTPTQNARAYGLLGSIFNHALRNQMITRNPCVIPGAGNVERSHKVRPLSVAQLAELVRTMPAKYRPMVLLAAWCALRFGELAELRRGDVDLTNGILYVARGVTRTKGGRVVGTPKSRAGDREINVPPHLIPMLRDHISARVKGEHGLLFPAADGVGHLAPSTLYKSFYRGRQLIGRPDLRFHDLRHTGAALYAATGATLADLMALLGHSTVGAAMIYQNKVQGRAAELAELMSEMAAVAEAAAAARVAV